MTSGTSVFERPRVDMRDLSLEKNDRVVIRPTSSANSTRVEVVLYRVDDEGRKIPPSYYAQRLASRLIKAGCRSSNASLPDVKLTFAPNDEVFALLDAIPSEHKFVDSGVEALREYWGELVKVLERNAETTRAFYENNELPEPIGVLSKIQTLATKNAVQSPGYLLLMEQGTGKTPCGIYAANMIGHHSYESAGKTALVLVIVPSNLRRNWEREFAKFSKAKGRVVCLRGGRMKRLKALTEGFSRMSESNLRFVTVIVSYDIAVNDKEILATVPWDLGIADESQYFKSSSTKRWKAMLMLRDACKKRMGLTGTPIGNSVLDLYTQMEWAGEHFSTCTSLEEFKRVFADVEVSGGGFEKIVGTKNHAKLTKQLSRISLIVDKKTALPDLPDKVYDLLECEMSPRQQKIYDEVATKLIIEAQAELAQGGPTRAMSAQHILTKLLRLSQIASGFVVWTKYPDGSLGAMDDPDLELEKEIECLEPNPKIETLSEVIAEKEPHQRSIIWSPWVQDIKSITTRLRADGRGVVNYYGGMSQDEKNYAEDAFNDVSSEIDVLVGNPSAGGVGLNLLGHRPDDESPSRYCDHMIYYAANWSYLDRSQSEARAHRRGTQCKLRITDLIIPMTIDEEIRMRVAQKKLNAELVTDVQNIIDSLVEAYGLK